VKGLVLYPGWYFALLVFASGQHGARLVAHAMVTRVRLEYEQYEEDWRKLQNVALLVRPIKDLAADQLSPAGLQDLNKQVFDLSPMAASVQPVTMGAAYFALSRYDSAVAALNLAPAEPKTLVLKAAAYGGLARDTTDSALKGRYEEAARDNLHRGLAAAEGTQDYSTVVQFARGSRDLSFVYQMEQPRK
jgi:hypothetical protein